MILVVTIENSTVTNLIAVLGEIPFMPLVVVFDLVNQWIFSNGEFKYDVGWLAASATKKRRKAIFEGNSRLLSVSIPSMLR